MFAGTAATNGTMVRRAEKQFSASAKVPARFAPDSGSRSEPICATHVHPVGVFRPRKERKVPGTNCPKKTRKDACHARLAGFGWDAGDRIVPGTNG